MSSSHAHFVCPANSDEQILVPDTPMRVVYRIYNLGPDPIIVNGHSRAIPAGQTRDITVHKPNDNLRVRTANRNGEAAGWYEDIASHAHFTIAANTEPSELILVDDTPIRAEYRIHNFGPGVVLANNNVIPAGQGGDVTLVPHDNQMPGDNLIVKTQHPNMAAAGWYARIT